MGKAMHKQLSWNDEMDLGLLREVVRVEPYDGEYGTLTARWKTIAATLSACYDTDIPYRSARERYDCMVEAFKASDKAQRLRGTGSAEDVTEQVQLLQDLVDRREAADETRKVKKVKDQKKRESLESTGSQLCQEAEERVSKRQRSSDKKDEKDESEITQILELEKKRHNDDHAYRMERLEYDREEQRIRMAQMEDNAKRNDQMDRMLTSMADFIKVMAEKKQ
jgi:hypothetical protein